MKKQSTYTLLVRSEEKSRNILETLLYAVFALSALVSIWQFAEQPSSAPLHRAQSEMHGCASGPMAS